MLFDQIRKFSNIFSKKIEKIEIDSNRCLKVRAVISECTSCLDVCPAGSIEISENLLEINETCINCGLCTAVCLTNALKWNHPPLFQLLGQITRLASREKSIFIGCSESLKGIVRANVVEIPCLGMLPAEFWLSLGNNVSNLTLIYNEKTCSNCQINHGQSLFLKFMQQAENIIRNHFAIESEWTESSEEPVIDHSRRNFLATILEEAKETKTITIKEVLEVEKAKSPFEKFDLYYKEKSESEEIIENVQEIKHQVIEKIVNETVIYTDKRGILFQELEMHPELKERMEFSIPQVDENCTRCGACAFLCPTDALIFDNESLILATGKCVSCGLCEEICYEKHIQMVSQTGRFFDEKYTFLLK